MGCSGTRRTWKRTCRHPPQGRSRKSHKTQGGHSSKQTCSRIAVTLWRTESHSLKGSRPPMPDSSWGDAECTRVFPAASPGSAKSSPHHFARTDASSAYISPQGSPRILPAGRTCSTFPLSQSSHTSSRAAISQHVSDHAFSLCTWRIVISLERWKVRPSGLGPSMMSAKTMMTMLMQLVIHLMLEDDEMEKLTGMMSVITMM